VINFMCPVVQSHSSTSLNTGY